MILVLLILIPLIGGVLSWALGRRSAVAARWAALLALTGYGVLAVGIWLFAEPVAPGTWIVEARWEWIPQLGISLHLALDGLSLLLVVLTAALGLVSVVASWTEIAERVGFFHFNLLWVLAGVSGVFLSLDLFLFYFFWEMMLIPMYFLIAIWGHERRTYASIKFFLFTQASGLLMLVAIVGLVFAHHAQTGILTFDSRELMHTVLDPQTAMLLMLGFFVAFAVKLPAFPFHSWLPDAHTEAPTAGSVVLAGLLLKTGAYGMLRFLLPLFPDAARAFAPWAMLLGVVGIIYGALLAFGQSDLKRLVAYTSVSHLGFVLLGIFAWNDLAHQGVVMQMICHGFSTGGLFVLVGTMQEQIHTRDMTRMGGLWEQVPRMGAVATVLAMASLGLPGLGNFIGEFLILFGSFRASVPLTIVATLGLVAATIYSLWIVQQAFHGEARQRWQIADLPFRHLVAFGSMIAILLWLGLAPGAVLKTAAPALESIRMQAASADVARGPSATGRTFTGVQEDAR